MRTADQVAQADEDVEPSAKDLGAGIGVLPQQQRLHTLHADALCNAVVFDLGITWPGMLT